MYMLHSPDFEINNHTIISLIEIYPTSSTLQTPYFHPRFEHEQTITTHPHYIRHTNSNNFKCMSSQSLFRHNIQAQHTPLYSIRRLPHLKITNEAKQCNIQIMRKNQHGLTPKTKTTH